MTDLEYVSSYGMDALPNWVGVAGTVAMLLFGATVVALCLVNRYRK